MIDLFSTVEDKVMFANGIVERKNHNIEELELYLEYPYWDMEKYPNFDFVNFFHKLNVLKLKNYSPEQYLEFVRQFVSNSNLPEEATPAFYNSISTITTQHWDSTLFTPTELKGLEYGLGYPTENYPLTFEQTFTLLNNLMQRLSRGDSADINLFSILFDVNKLVLVEEKPKCEKLEAELQHISFTVNSYRCKTNWWPQSLIKLRNTCSDIIDTLMEKAGGAIFSDEGSFSSFVDLCFSVHPSESNKLQKIIWVKKYTNWLQFERVIDESRNRFTQKEKDFFYA